MTSSFSELSPESKKQLLELAAASQRNSHSPYSGFKIGASVLDEAGQMFGGCNVENASYGGTVCAERVAFFKGISEGAKRFQALLVYSESEKPWPPCGLCRQSLVEHMTLESWVYLANSEGIQAELRVKDLVPYAFSAEQLTEGQA